MKTTEFNQRFATLIYLFDRAHCSICRWIGRKPTLLAEYQCFRDVQLKFSTAEICISSLPKHLEMNSDFIDSARIYSSDLIDSPRHFCKVVGDLDLLIEEVDNAINDIPEDGIKYLERVFKLLVDIKIILNINQELFHQLDDDSEVK